MGSFHFDIAKQKMADNVWSYTGGSTIGGAIKAVLLMQDATSTLDLPRDLLTVDDCIGSVNPGTAEGRITYGYDEWDGTLTIGGGYEPGFGDRETLDNMTTSIIVEGAVYLTHTNDIEFGEPTAGTYAIRALLIIHEDDTGDDSGGDTFPIAFIDGGNLNTELNGTGQPMSVSWSGRYGQWVDSAYVPTPP